MTVIVKVGVGSTLDFSKVFKEVRGDEIVWEFDLDLSLPFSDEVQFNSIRFGIEHFLESYALFKERTRGFLLYRGVPPKDPNFLRFLNALLPQESKLYLALDLRSFSLEEKLAYLATPDFDPYQLELTGWIESIDEKAPNGVLWPRAASSYATIARFIERFEGALRLCKGHLLNQQWEGLDRLYIDKEAISSQEKRAVMGFEAAGGEVIML